MEEAGYDVLEAVSGVEACRLIDDRNRIDLPNHIDLVVTDLNMPEANGVVVAKRARAHIPGVPVLFVSARCDLLKSMSAPRPYSYLAKPFGMKQFSEVVDAFLTP